MSIEKDLEVLETIEKHPPLTPAVVCFVVNDGKVLLGVRESSSIGLGVGKVSGLGGRAEEEDGGDTVKTLKREMFEESDLEVIEYKNCGTVRFYYMNPEKQHWGMEVEVFLITEWNGTPKSKERLSLEWFQISDLPLDRMWRDNSFWVPQILAGNRVDATFIFGMDGEIAYQKVDITSE